MNEMVMVSIFSLGAFWCWLMTYSIMETDHDFVPYEFGRVPQSLKVYMRTKSVICIKCGEVREVGCQDG